MIHELLAPDGSAVAQQEDEITCEVSGPGRLLALENASRDASENYRDNLALANHGRLVAYVQALESEGAISVGFTSPGLEGVKAVLSIGQ